jgi:hypothetical protein
MTKTKTHLVRNERRAACGILIWRANGHPIPTTTVLADVTCQSCQSSLWMAQREINESRRPRR